MQGRRDAGQKGCRTVGMQDRRNAGQEGCRRGGTQSRMDRRDAGKTLFWRFFAVNGTKIFA